MNERIQELAKLAQEDYVGYQGKGLYYEIFAKLIIRECADVIHKRIGPKSALDVLEHFGVE